MKMTALADLAEWPLVALHAVAATFVIGAATSAGRHGAVINKSHNASRGLLHSWRHAPVAALELDRAQCRVLRAQETFLRARCAGGLVSTETKSRQRIVTLLAPRARTAAGSTRHQIRACRAKVHGAKPHGAPRRASWAFAGYARPFDTVRPERADLAVIGCPETGA